MRHASQIALYKHITDYVRICFGRAKSTKRKATGLVMVMLQKQASSSTDAVLSALRTRLFRLENGEDEDASNAIDYSIPTLVEVGFIERPSTGIYTKPSLNAATEIVLSTYRESFFLNNPLLNRNKDYDGSPYFEFVR